jgi:hypothetical protein
MRKTFLVVPLLMLSLSCSNFTWKGMGHGLSEDESQRGLKDATELAREYDTQRYWAEVRARRDGRVNAWGRGFDRMQNTIDRYLFNYSPDDPYVNYPTDNTVLGEAGEFTLGLLAR